MADLDLSFRAQSLDNQSLDPVEVNNQRLTEEHVGERQEFAKKISKISLDGIRVFSEGAHTASLHDHEFLLKTPSEQLDDAGRIAPLLCYGSVPDEPPVSWSRDVVKAMVGFAESIDRTISPESQEIAGRGVDTILAEAQKKSEMYTKGKVLREAGVLLINSAYHVVKIPIGIMRLRILWKKMLWGARGLVIVLLQNPFHRIRRKLKKWLHRSEPRPGPKHPTNIKETQHDR